MEFISYEKNLEDLKQSFKSLLIEKLGDEEKKQYEDFSDIINLLLEAVSYRDYMFRMETFIAIENLFLESAEGEDLERLVRNYYPVNMQENNMIRISCTYPRAKINLKRLSNFENGKYTIKKGSIFFTDANNKAVLLNDVVFNPGGENIQSADLELQKEMLESSEKATRSSENYLFLDKIDQIENFKGGEYKENDEDLKIRALESLKKSTAGSTSSYKTMVKEKTQNRVKDIKIITNVSQDSIVHFYNFDGIEDKQERLKDELEKIFVKLKKEDLEVKAKSGNFNVTDKLVYQLSIICHPLTDADKEKLEQVIKEGKETPAGINIKVKKAVEKKYDIEGEIISTDKDKKKLNKILDSQKPEIEKQVKIKLKTLEKIGRDIKEFEIKYIIASIIKEISDVNIKDIILSKPDFTSLSNAEFNKVYTLNNINLVLKNE